MFDPNFLFVAGLGLLAWILLRRVYRRLGRRRKNEPAIARVPRPTAGPRRQLSDAPPEIAQYEVQLHDKARELTAVLDSKMAALNALVQQSQQQIDRLETLLGDAEPPAAAPRAASSQGPAAATAVSADAAEAELYLLADQGFSAVTIAHRLRRPLAEVQERLAQRSQ